MRVRSEPLNLEVQTNNFDLMSAASQVRANRDEGAIIVQCHGVFDVLHPGHLSHLTEAKAQGDLLIVTITPDRFVNKGPGRPVFTQEQRATMLSALDIVDFVAITNSPTAEDAISLIRPNIYVKGPDYRNSQDDISGNIGREEEAVYGVGGVVYFTQSPTMSSSRIINATQPTSYDSTSSWFHSFRSKYSETEVLDWLERARDLNVLVIGEAIIDEYVRCEALGKSSKDPVLAFREISIERQVGGSLAIAAHCAGIGARVSVLFRMGNNPADKVLISESLDADVNAVAIVSEQEPTILKRRFIDDLTEARVFETYVMSDERPTDSDDSRFREKFRELAVDADVVLVADYGHGLLSEGAVEDLAVYKGVLAINTQSNAGNRGFNTISRYPRVDYVCLNGNEVGLELRRRHLTMNELVPQLRERTGAARAVVTEGSKGVAICDSDGQVIHAPAFAQIIRDRVGAGDALFATTSLLFAVGTPADVSGFFGNLAGAASVGELGNRSHVSRVDLIRHASALLK